MRIIFFIFILFLCNACVSKTTSQLPDVVSSTEIKSSSQAATSLPKAILSSEIKLTGNGNIAYAIKNESDRLLYYYVGLEAEIDGQWRAIIIDVNKDGDPRSARILEIGPAGLRHFSMNSKLKLKNFSDLHRFRLSIQYGSRVDSLTSHSYATPFEVL